MLKRTCQVVAVLVSVLLVGSVLTGCSSDDKASTAQPATSASQTTTEGHARVEITDKGFVPATVTVTAGQRVVWTNTGKSEHAVSIEGGSSSGAMKPGVTASHVFDKPGTYNYHDPSSPNLRASVIVK